MDTNRSVRGMTVWYPGDDDPDLIDDLDAWGNPITAYSPFDTYEEQAGER